MTKLFHSIVGISPPKKGEIGIEIEMEGDDHFPHDPSLIWYDTEDNSLRGYCREYVTNGPINYDEIDSAIDHLRDVLKDKGVNVKQSFRAGVHVHINCLNLTLEQILTFAAAYYCMETALIRYCGPNRENNLFCLRLRDAEWPLVLLKKILEGKPPSILDTDDIRYGALNLRSLFRHGTLEFRALETTPDFKKIADWAKALYRLKETSLSIVNRKDIAYDMSYFGPRDWVEKMVGPQFLKEIDYPDLEKDVMRDMRFVQEFLHTGLKIGA
jgi:hypothetical protein